ncbi:hypothetical protein Tcan_05274 [Toxocara canis]|uniref:Uncharacterized protein n=1 Tax=Toxocara canis TaxID=6265 RepID=A0A0B2VJ88_TOXCA|nr:hypothetical protein Tcan_05274 [Toxocara canis]
MTPTLELFAFLALFSLLPPCSTNLLQVPFERRLTRYKANKKADSYGPSSDGIESFDTLAGLGLGKRSERFEEANTFNEGYIARKQFPNTITDKVYPSKK